MNLAEVFVLRSDLDSLCGGNLISLDVNSSYTPSNKIPCEMVFPKLHVTKAISYNPLFMNVGRYGRHLIFEFTSCRVLFNMSRNTSFVMYKEDPGNSVSYSVKLVITITDGLRYLVYQDPSEVGSMTVYSRTEIPAEFSCLGLDILHSNITGEYLSEEAKNYVSVMGNLNPVSVKEFLIDDTIISGIDNEFVSEALFLAGLSPFYDIRKGLNNYYSNLILESLTEMYLRAIDHIQNNSANTVVMSLDKLYTIYGREGERCFACGGKVLKSVINNKDTYWCDQCQLTEVKDECTRDSK